MSEFNGKKEMRHVWLRYRFTGNMIERRQGRDALRPHFDALARVAYFKIVLRPLTPLKRRLHGGYRALTWTLIVLYNLQHFIRVIQSSNIDEVVDTLFILLTTLNALAKQIAFNARSGRIDNIIGLIDGPIFALKKPYHATVMRSNALVSSRLLKLYHFAAISCGILWAIFPIVNRILGEKVVFTGYIPFDTSSNITFGLAHGYMITLITFQAYANVTLDCTIVAFFSQARTQIQILRHNLEQLANLDGGMKKRIGYKDDGGTVVQRRLTRCVEHHKRIVWFVKEIESIFGEAMVLQFLVMAWVICMTVYKITSLNILSAEFVSMAMYLMCMLAQLFLYCYFGTQLQVESEFLNQSMYNSDWLSLSPKFRRQLLVMMRYSYSPIAPRTAYIVPMSLDTYTKVLKSSYTLFTFLNR